MIVGYTGDSSVPLFGTSSRWMHERMSDLRVGARRSVIKLCSFAPESANISTGLLQGLQGRRSKSGTEDNRRGETHLHITYRVNHFLGEDGVVCTLTYRLSRSVEMGH